MTYRRSYWDAGEPTSEKLRTEGLTAMKQSPIVDIARGAAENCSGQSIWKRRVSWILANKPSTEWVLGGMSYKVMRKVRNVR